MKAKIMLLMDDEGKVASNMEIANANPGELASIYLNMEMMKDKLKLLFERSIKKFEK